MTEPSLGHAILLAVALQRLLELSWASANARRLVARGGVLVPGDGTPGLVALHAGWLAGILAERTWLSARMPDALAWPVFLALVGVEALRAWTLSTLGRRWTIRVVVVPGEEPVARGPYRFLRHPNYVVVALEVALIPVWLGAWRTAALFALPHAIGLAYRIRREEAAWRETAARPLGRSPEPEGTRAAPP